jgi:hypothetical protein
MTQEHRVVYMCEVCLRCSTQPETCHSRPMLRCDAGCPGDDCTKPLESTDGRLLTHAPRWWILRKQAASK